MKCFRKLININLTRCASLIFPISHVSEKRDKILREIISNILAHRDYSNAYSAQFIIEKDRIYTKNSNLPHGHGELQLNKFEPFAKNPPIFIEDNIFKIVIPMSSVAGLQVGPKEKNKETNKETKYHINVMKKTGIIEHIGSTKKGKWIVHK